jgi:hypothetical protein
VVGKKAGGSRHLYGMGSTLFKSLESACNLSDSSRKNSPSGRALCQSDELES